jgi:hypothetical protein
VDGLAQVGVPLSVPFGSGCALAVSDDKTFAQPRVVSSVILGRWLRKIGSALVRVIDVTVRRSG